MFSGCLLACYLLLLLLVYARPYTRSYTAWTWPEIAAAYGVHGTEQLDELAYAYSDGGAELRFPEVGVTTYMVDLQIGGISGSVTTTAQIAMEGHYVVLPDLATVRDVHLLVPAGADGDLDLRVSSPVVTVPPDPRPLGVLVGDVGFASLGRAAPPPSMLVTAPLVLGLVAFSARQIGIARHWILTGLLLLSLLVGGSVVLLRGQVAIQPMWIILGLCAVAASWLMRAERRGAALSWRGMLFLLLGWRVGLWVVSGVGLWYSREFYRYWHDRYIFISQSLGEREQLLDRLLTEAWLRYDSFHYLAIAGDGYVFSGARWPNIAFFPLYPLLIRWLGTLLGYHYEITALLIANAMAAFALLLLHRLVARDFDPLTAFRATLFLVLFPTSFFFVAGYTESLALALVVAAIWAMRRHRWWLAGVLGGLLALTRSPGVLMAPAILLCYLASLDWKWRQIRSQVLASLLPPLGLGLFMAYQWGRFGTPWAFLIAQRNWDNGLSPPWVIPMAILDQLWSPQWELATLQLVVWLGILALALLGLRRLPLAYSLPGLLLLLPPYLATIPGSLPRHVLISAPVFVMLARLDLSVVGRWLLLWCMLAGLVVLTLMFSLGFFVA